MKTRVSILLVLFLILVFFPSVVYSYPGAITAGSSSPLKHVDTVYETGLRGARSLVASPDGWFIYTASSVSNAITIFRRDIESGELTFVEAIRDGVGGVDGLDGASDIAMSPDGKHVYTSSAFDHAVNVFSRDSISGMLTLLEIYQDGDTGFEYISNPASILSSPDGSYIYIASNFDHAITACARDLDTGLLTPVDLKIDGLSGVDGLEGVIDLSMSPDGTHIYAASAGDNKLAVFHRSLTTGQLTFIDFYENGIDAPGFDVPYSSFVSQDGKNVYATAFDDKTLVVFERDLSTGELLHLETFWDGIDGVDGLHGGFSVKVSHDDQNVYVASYGDDSVTIFGRSPSNGSLTYLGLVSPSNTGIDELISAQDVLSTSDGKHAYAVGPGPGGVVSFHRDQESGILEAFDSISSGYGLDGVVGIAASNDGCVYTTGNNADSITSFFRDDATGKLKYQSTLIDGVGGADGLDGARSVVVDPDGYFIFVAGHNEGAIAIFSTGLECKSLWYHGGIRNLEGGVTGLDGPQALAMSPDGSLLYAANELGDSLVVFDVDSTNGTLSHRQTLQDGIGGVNGLQGAYAVAASRDGNHVYVAGYYSNAVTVFEWETGALTFKERVTDGVFGVDGLNRANSVIVSPDDAHVYVASRTDDAVAIFSRDQVTGLLSYLGLVMDDTDGVDGLAGARAIAISPDGKLVYVASQYDHALAVFSRDASSGLLTYLGMHQDGDGMIEGLGTANGVAVSPDGGYVYVTGYDDDAVVIFARWRVFLPMGLR